MPEIHGVETKLRPKRLMRNGVPVTGTCYECGQSFTHYVWSPLWCPECDAKRIKRITNSMDEIICKMEATDA